MTADSETSEAAELNEEEIKLLQALRSMRIKPGELQKTLQGIPQSQAQTEENATGGFQTQEGDPQIFHRDGMSQTETKTLQPAEQPQETTLFGDYSRRRSKFSFGMPSEPTEPLGGL
jgi:hypothetical protein